MGQFALAVRHSWYSYLRKKGSEKRGGGWKRWDLDVALDHLAGQCDDLPELFAALDQLEDALPRASQVLHLKFFLMMRVEEITSVMAISRSTVEADLRLAKAFVRSQIDSVGAATASPLLFRSD